MTQEGWQFADLVIHSSVFTTSPRLPLLQAQLEVDIVGDGVEGLAVLPLSSSHVFRASGESIQIDHGIQPGNIGVQGGNIIDDHPVE